MGLNNDNNCVELCRSADASKDNNCQGDGSSPAKNRDDMQHDACESSAPLGINASHVVSSENAEVRMDLSCSGREEDNKSASCALAAINNSDRGVEAVESQTSPESPNLHMDTIDRQLESRKNGRFADGTVYKLSAPSSLKCHEQDENMIKSNKAAGSDEMHGNFSQTSAENNVDEYDIEEEDVKVCDICGDAGREDLLAVCSRCSDGAEHTYCMREMLDKVPDGDWLCEECKYNEELEERKQEHYKMFGMSERSRFLGRTSSVSNDLYVKLDGKDPLCERSKMKNVSQNKQVSSKRTGDSFDAGPTAKRQALESSMGSPTASSSSRVAVLSKDNKSLDKTKGKPSNRFSTGIESTGDSSEIVRSPISNSLNASKGNFMKSNSFSSGNSKLNVKVSDEFLQKQKHGVDAKEMPGKLITKSMSFKGLGRSNVSEPKVKMLSPQCAPVQEFKGQKQGRDRSLLERKNTIKLDHSVPGQNSKRASRGENISSLSVPNNRDHKNCQSDGKLTTFSKHSCHSVHKLPDATANTGEAKRLSSTSTSGSVPVNGTSSSAEARSSPVSVKEVPVLNFIRTADRSVVSDNGTKADVLDNQNEKMIENSGGRLRQGVNSGVAGGNRRELSTDASVSKTKEGIHKENNLKAAIEAAMQKKQDMFKKNRNLDKPSELSTSNSQGNHVGVAVGNISSDVLSEEGMLDGDAALRNHIVNSCKQTSIGSLKQFKVYPADGATPAGESVLTVSAIPEQESVWQGGFEIHRSGKFPDMCGGFQAHLSSIASGKVLEAVKKFPQKIVLDEVSRPCVWPVQFKEIGAQEDNIALYFFAKDPESYIRSYKILVDYLMKHDLALRGNVNEIELLVFPSNHLPDKSQCWNALFFMWGVFRGRRPLCPDNRSGLLDTPEISLSNLIPICKDVASNACPDDFCLRKPVMEDFSVSSSSHLVLSGCDTPASVRSNLQYSGSLSNGDCCNQICPVDRTCSSSQTSSENPLRGAKYNSSSSGAEACSESESAALKDHNAQEPVKVADHQRLAAKEIDRGNHLHEAHKSPSYHVHDKDISSHSCEVPLISVQAGASVVSSEQHGLDTVNIIDSVKSESSLNPELDCVDNIKKNGCDVKIEDDVKQEVDEMDSKSKNDRGKLKLEYALKQEGPVDINMSADNNMEELHKMQLSPKRHLCEDHTNTMTQATSGVTLRKRSWMDGENPLESRDEASTNRRRKGGDDFSGSDLYGLPSSFKYNSSSGSVQPQRHGVSTSSRAQESEDTCNEADDEKSTSADVGLAERYLFLDDLHSHPVASIPSGLENESMHWKVGLSENEDQLHDGSPNLELALGVDKKQSRSAAAGGVPSYFAGHIAKKDPDRPPDVAMSSKEEEDKEEDASASLSLSLAFPFSDKEKAASRLGSGRHELNTSLLLFRGSSHK